MGCIHTTQGYDLNYSAIIFGNEITYDPERDEIIINKDEYFDSTGKNSIKDPNDLKNYILNIYRTIMLRGIRGTFVYACNKELRAYLSRYIPLQYHEEARYNAPENVTKIIPKVNAVKLFDLQVAAGDFSIEQTAEHKDWVLVPENIDASQSGLFACRVVGESMNRIIQNDPLCLFRIDQGGSRNGKIVLVEQSEVIDIESGSNYTVKEYRSSKVEDENGWTHNEISLNPLSYDKNFVPIVLTSDDEANYRVVGEFICVLD